MHNGSGERKHDTSANHAEHHYDCGVVKLPEPSRHLLLLAGRLTVQKLIVDDVGPYRFSWEVDCLWGN